MVALSLVMVFALSGTVSGTVFLDRNGNGRRDPGERGLPGVVVSDQIDVVATDVSGGFALADSRGFGLVFVSVPSGYRSVGPFWRRVAEGALEFPLAAAPAPTGAGGPSRCSPRSCRACSSPSS